MGADPTLTGRVRVDEGQTDPTNDFGAEQLTISLGSDLPPSPEALRRELERLGRAISVLPSNDVEGRGLALDVLENFARSAQGVADPQIAETIRGFREALRKAA